MKKFYAKIEFMCWFIWQAFIYFGIGFLLIAGVLMLAKFLNI